MVNHQNEPLIVRYFSNSFIGVYLFVVCVTDNDLLGPYILIFIDTHIP